ncbi:MAG: glutathione synthase, partial [Myxococcota bacterium]|nr:glutathione synthase [Myxococcota bacterium]
MRHLFLMDPIEEIRIDLDSTFALMLEAQRRSHEVLYATVDHLHGKAGECWADARAASLTTQQGDHARLGPWTETLLGDVDVVWMRKDPPFDMAYIFTTYLLDMAERDAMVVNAPAGLRAFNEKAWTLHFPELVPPSLVTRSGSRLRGMMDEVGPIVVKPLDGNGGEGVFIVRPDDPNLGVILETSTQHETRTILAQQYLPEAVEGDKRIILVDGEPVGACLRVPTGVDHRGNIHVGARVEACGLSTRDQQICAAIGPQLREAGQVFVGIDVIGDYLTEVNVTSPTCIHEINAFDGIAYQTVTATTADDDTAAFTLSTTTASVTEAGSTATLTVVLDTQPL